MFTGIIETLGKVESVTVEGTGKVFWISSSIAPELKVDQSISHNGACLTVDQLKDTSHRVTAIQETLFKTNLDSWRVGDLVNLERCLAVNGRLDGHLVQGHVDATATCISMTDKNGSREYEFSYPAQFAPLIIEKGSVCLNGISLTLFDVGIDRFRVAIIPYTIEFTNIGHVQPGDSVNIEFDIIGKYINRWNELKK